MSDIRMITLGEARDSLSALAGQDVGEVTHFMVIAHRADGSKLIFGRPGCNACRVLFLAETVEVIAADMTHDPICEGEVAYVGLCGRVGCMIDGPHAHPRQEGVG